MKLTSRLSILFVVTSTLAMAPDGSAQQDYVSPYSLALTVPTSELLAPDSVPPRDDWHLEAKIPHSEWYTPATRKRWGAWGPSSRQYPPIADQREAPLNWKRQRVLAVADKYVGLPYQHHHIPDWNPPADWSRLPVAYGRNSKGVDCSDFTSWVYNYGLGIRLDTGIGEQAAAVDIAGPGGEGTMHIRTIENDVGYADLVKKLRTGDLLYVKNNAGKISHVIMWVGEFGRSPDGTPLVIDCTGGNHRDSNGMTIPIGVNLRPFTPDSWYFKSFSHAHRILHERVASGGVDGSANGDGVQQY